MNKNIEIETAVRHFRSLLEEQIERSERISQNKNDDSPEKVKIGICDGDGIGPVITKSATEVLKCLLHDKIKTGKAEIVTISGLTIENRKKCQKAIPDGVLEQIKDCTVLLKGPTETIKGGTLESANVALRRELDLYANVRPVRIPEKNIDWVFFRENTEGEYVLGSRGIEISDTLCFDFKVTTIRGTKRIAEKAFEYAKQHGMHKMTVVTKANIMKKTDGMFSQICHTVSENYPEITTEERYIDIVTANLIDEKINGDFSVFVLPNLYGDIITDEAAQLQGGVGTAGSANIGDKYAMFEAIHGTAPGLVLAGLSEYANPTSILKATEMLLSHIGFAKESKLLNTILKDPDICSLMPTGERCGHTCLEYTTAILERIEKLT